MRRGMLALAAMLALLGGAAGAQGQVQVVATFDPQVGQFPEGLAVDAAGNAFVGMGPTGQVVRVTPAGEVGHYAQFPDPGEGFLAGLALDAAGNLYAALATFGEGHGVWRVTPAGVVEQVAAMPADSFPNAVVIDGAGNLLVSDTVGGRIWLIPPGGEPAVWAADELLRGIIPVVSPLGLPLGVNGLGFAPNGGALYATVTEHARVVRIPILPDGSAGPVEVVAQDPVLTGADGLAVGPDGTIYVAANFANSIVAVEPATGALTVVASGEPLRFPATVRFTPGYDALLVTNFDAARLLGLEEGTPMPGLVRVDLGAVQVPMPPATGNAGLAPMAQPSTAVAVALGGLALIATVGAAVVRRQA